MLACAIVFLACSGGRSAKSLPDARVPDGALPPPAAGAMPSPRELVRRDGEIPMAAPAPPVRGSAPTAPVTPDRPTAPLAPGPGGAAGHPARTGEPDVPSPIR
jgi:hypothetical protein